MVNKLELLGRKWFDRVNGNTYFSAVALHNGLEIARIDFEYGYADQWLYEITKAIKTTCFEARQDQQPWQYIDKLESQGIAVFKSCEQVTAKKRLKFN
jgi:hypothetical protein